MIAKPPGEPRRFHYYDLLVHIFVVILLISNLVGQKVTAIGWFRISGAQVFFPITYIFGDVFTEVYGYAASRRAIWIGFMASALLAVLGLFAVWLPPAPEWQHQDAFAVVFEFVPRMTTDVRPPGPPVCTMLRPGTLLSASETVRRCWRCSSCDVITVTELAT